MIPDASPKVIYKAGNDACFGMTLIMQYWKVPIFNDPLLCLNKKRPSGKKLCLKFGYFYQILRFSANFYVGFLFGRHLKLPHFDTFSA